jgi:2-polyprenyl-3-methyl-5-hydroxy-6-metoxy-1,4-benzoquinol methylase
MNRSEFIKEQMFGKVLDIGCEYGSLHEIILNENVYGLDLKIKKHRKKVMKGDAQILPFKKNSFDTIIAGELIEHLPNPKKFLKESHRILKTGGIIILSTPNKKSLINRILKSSFVTSHISLFDIPSIKKAMNEYFKIEKTFCLPYDDVSSWGSKHKKMYWLRKLIHPLLPFNLQENVILLARKNR